MAAEISRLVVDKAAAATPAVRTAAGA